MLIHMAPQEVAGLQALAKAAGGTLTVNPETGLAEAGFLKNLLPTLIGVGLTAATGGALAPWMVGLGMGAVETARTGSLEKGLMAGLGAYGGAGLGAGLMGAGAANATAAANPQLAASEIGREMGQAGFVQPTAAAKMSAGIQGLGTEAGRSAALSSMGGGMGAARYGLAALSGPMMQGAPQAQYDGGGPNPYEYDYDPNTQRYTRVPTGTRQRDQLAAATPAPITTMPAPTTSMPMMAAGGPVEEMSDRNAALTLMADGGQMYAAGGVSHLGDYSDGGRLLKGPGDGVSDSIPATIADKRPARLADGEFVVPARIVSELGNGSTEAGARKLYAMMDRIQKARGKTTGKNRVAVDSRAEKALPA